MAVGVLRVTAGGAGIVGPRKRAISEVIDAAPLHPQRSPLKPLLGRLAAPLEAFKAPNPNVPHAQQHLCEALKLPNWWGAGRRFQDEPTDM